ncbi:hypothetical protein Sj15T_30930 [Sphingobium sp. TA15]|uniref:Uncharacterized protein n=1 Tax=Sphingobium indicum (strain DSM 16413 / CCM 7287 / MTCC 6362 / UT26 / NBRC 101211 / UT26S) TaxID=452662 RepID=D4YXX1_SPHIU|nr:hypothetical protein [Sphingobium indicum]BAI95203.1 hypothetical protein SJA_C1-03690 [Sphingobium indicum UT26S]BDD68072.1 hypothetical protein Sj15T_30930 [Sphingobium sp. TA15]
MISKNVIASLFVGVCCATPAPAQASNTYNANFVFQQTLPVITKGRFP